jgi:hypothetical protein
MQGVRLKAVATALVMLLAACTAKPQGEPGAFGGAAPIDDAFQGRIYDLPEGAAQLPDFHTLQPVGSVYVHTLDVPDQDFHIGFPGVTNRFEWFAIDYTGVFAVSQAGDYGFRLSSDDGSRLFIDGKPVIDDDGAHPTRTASGQANLTAGRHSIEVRYFQGPAQRVSLQLFCTQGAGKEAIFPACGLNLVRADLLPPWVLWLAALVVVLIIAFVVTRRRPAAATPSV